MLCRSYICYLGHKPSLSVCMGNAVDFSLLYRLHPRPSPPCPPLPCRSSKGERQRYFEARSRRRCNPQSKVQPRRERIANHGCIHKDPALERGRASRVPGHTPTRAGMLRRVLLDARHRHRGSGEGIVSSQNLSSSSPTWKLLLYIRRRYRLKSLESMNHETFWGNLFHGEDRNGPMLIRLAVTASTIQVLST